MKKRKKRNKKKKTMPWKSNKERNDVAFACRVGILGCKVAGWMPEILAEGECVECRSS